MSILEVENITFSYSGENLYQKASMRLFEGEHAVLVGPNGTGKTTLLKLLEKQFSPDEGSITWMPNKKVGYLDQYAQINPKLLVKNYLYEVFLPLFEKEREMERLYESLVDAPEAEHDRILNWASSFKTKLIPTKSISMAAILFLSSLFC